MLFILKKNDSEKFINYYYNEIVYIFIKIFKSIISKLGMGVWGWGIGDW